MLYYIRIINGRVTDCQSFQYEIYFYIGFEIIEVISSFMYAIYRNWSSAMQI